MDNVLSKEFSEDVASHFRNIISSLLPHNKHNRNLAPNLLLQTKKVLEVNEVYGYDFVLYKFIDENYNIQRLFPDFIPDLLLANLTMKLEVTLQDIILSPVFNLERTLSDNGIVCDMTDAEQRQLALDTVFSGVLSLYQELFNLEVSTSDGFLELELLRETVIKNLNYNMVMILGEALTQGVTYNRKVYLGDKGVKDLMARCQSDMDIIRGAISVKSEGCKSLHTLEEHIEFNANAASSVFPMFKWGVRPIDDVSPIMNSDVVTIIGDEGTGKTHFIAEQVTQCILSGKDAIVMTGETSITKMYHLVLSNYIYKTRSFKFDWKELLNIDSLGENPALIVRSAMAELASDKVGHLHLRDRFTYETFKQEIEDILASNDGREFGGVFIDHIGQLRTNGDYTDKGRLQNDKMRVDFLYYQAILLGDEKDLPVFLVAHTGSEATSQAAKGKETGVRIGGLSGNTSKDADIVIYMHTTPDWKKQGLVQFICKKYREAPFFQPFLIKIDFVVSRFEYKEEYQVKNIDENSVIENADDLYD